MAAQYNSYFESIKSRLPKNIVRLQEEHLLFATTVKSFERHSDDVFILTLDYGGFNSDNIKLTFIGVSNIVILENFEDAYLCYVEIFVNDKDFELQILFDIIDSPTSEFSIRANIVLIELSYQTSMEQLLKELVDLTGVKPEDILRNFYSFCFFEKLDSNKEESFRIFYVQIMNDFIFFRANPFGG